MTIAWRRTWHVAALATLGLFVFVPPGFSDPPFVIEQADPLGDLARILEDGHRAGAFQRVNPVVFQAGIVAPILFFFATARLRRKLARGGATGAAELSTAAVVAHVQQLALAQLEGRLS